MMDFSWMKDLDKKLHFLGGSILYSAGHIAGPYLGIGATTAAVLLLLHVIVGKELWDRFRKNGTGFSFPDILAGIFGAAASGIAFSVASAILRLL